MEKGRKLLEELQKPFSSEQIEWRVRAATGNHGNFKVLVVPYITSRTVMQRLDDVCGGYWQSNFDRIVVGDVEAFQCRISIKLEDEWVTRTDASEVTDYESVKGGHSNAFKRAAIHWGIGRYLYNVNSFWVDVKKNGQHSVRGNFKVKGTDTFIQGYFDTPTLPNWARPDNSNHPNNDDFTPQIAQSSQASQTVQNSNNAEQRREDGKGDQEKAVKLVSTLLEKLNVSEENAAFLLKKASGTTVHYTSATPKDLGKLYHVLAPVYNYLLACKAKNLKTQDSLYYAQIVLKVKLESLHSLFFLMTNELANEAIQLLEADMQLQESI